MLDHKDQVLYVGKAKNLKKRVLSYTRSQGHSVRIQRMIAETRGMVFVTTDTEVQALLLEATLIKKYAPRYNVLMRDDKSFGYILLRTDHESPQLTKHRGAKTKKGAYYGPFPSMNAINETLVTLHKVFKLRSCKDTVFNTRRRPCLQYHIKRCSGPCVGLISQEAYGETVAQAQAFLEGRGGSLQKDLAVHMEQASAAQNYELAAIYRDRIQALTRVQAQQTVHLPQAEDCDIMALCQMGGVTCIQVFFFRAGNAYGNQAYYPVHDQDQDLEWVLRAFLAQFYTRHDPPPHLYLSHTPHESELLAQAFSEKAGYKVHLSVPKRGLKKTLVTQAYKNAQEDVARKLASRSSQRNLLTLLKEFFQLPSVPQRIEVYDNSHISGAFAVGVFIVVTPEGFQKNAYRTFKIDSKTLTPGDDYAMMREVLTRRFKGSLSQEGTPLPDMIIVDGGAGHLSTAHATLESQGLAHKIFLLGVAKGPNRNAGRETFYVLGKKAFQLESQEPLLYFLQRLRDEAHRFAIGTHRHQRHKAIGSSSLDAIPGVGRKRKQALLKHFGSARAVETAGIHDLKAVEGIDEKMAQLIYRFFQR